MAYLDAQYKYLRVQSGIALTCDTGIALGPRLELYPMDHGHPHRVTSQFPVSVYDARIALRWMSLLRSPQLPSSGPRAQGMSTVDIVQLVCKKVDSEEKRSCA